DMSDRSSNGRHAHGAGLEQCKRPGLMARGKDHQVRLPHQRIKLPLSEKSMKPHSRTQSQARRQRLNFTLQRILSDYIQLKFNSRLRQRCDGPQQGALILDPIEAANMNQPRRLAGVPRHWIAWGPDFEV